MKTIDINSDLGEGFGDYVMADDAAILELITSANVACGFHAGDFMTMHETAVLAKKNGVSIGAHVGYPDRQGFGRRHIAYTAKELELMTLYQLGALSAIAEHAGTRLTHANFHGALGNLSFVDDQVALAALRAFKAFDPGLKFVALPHTAAYRAAQKLGLDIVASFLADRAYTPDGVLVSRKTAGAVIHDPALVRERVQRVLQEGKVRAIDGTDLDMPADSILVHSDTRGAIEIARTIRQAAEDIGCRIAAFA
ncbi:LamB/YcsF family protein [Bordetella sp. BOR01]|uniref:LamB/YcsF family protein n=1 Tax=Bordetella sp. BOR01 TaxID=2854779 RepID=UPI001C4382C6|nr:5-oxoprolinase subunit PxpA [Bordetella sp. BOR01]MBV7483807.1 5-oxoprolinase subunit PxpA [Bordetella sp. BOR01]